MVSFRYWFSLATHTGLHVLRGLVQPSKPLANYVDVVDELMRCGMPQAWNKTIGLDD